MIVQQDYHMILCELQKSCKRTYVQVHVKVFFFLNLAVVSKEEAEKVYKVTCFMDTETEMFSWLFVNFSNVQCNRSVNFVKHLST